MEFQKQSKVKLYQQMNSKMRGVSIAGGTIFPILCKYVWLISVWFQINWNSSENSNENEFNESGTRTSYSAYSMTTHNVCIREAQYVLCISMCLSDCCFCIVESFHRRLLIAKHRFVCTLCHPYHKFRIVWFFRANVLACSPFLTPLNPNRFYESFQSTTQYIVHNVRVVVKKYALQCYRAVEWIDEAVKLFWFVHLDISINSTVLSASSQSLALWIFRIFASQVCEISIESFLL